MVDFKKDTWLYALIAAILAIIALFTPWGTLEIDLTLLGFDTYTASSWLGGAVQNIPGLPAVMGPEWQGNGLGLWTFGLTVFSIALLLFYGVNTWKGKEFKWDWLMYLLSGLVMLICPILTLVLEGTSGAVIGFAPIGIIIAGVIAIGAFAVDKFVGREQTE